MKDHDRILVTALSLIKSLSCNFWLHFTMYMYRSTCTTHSPTFLWGGLNLTFLRIIRAGPTGQYLNIHKQIILHDSMVGSNAFSAWAYYTWSVCSRAPRVRQCGKLPIQENLVITWPYTDWPTAWESVRTTGIPVENNSINRYGNRNAAQGFIWKEIAWPGAPGL